MVVLKDLLTPKKAIRPYLERFRKNKDALPPISVEIHWTSACNYNCIHCSYGYRRKLKTAIPENVTKELFSDLVNLGVKTVYLSGGGEPTLYPNWWIYSETLLSGGVDIALITNGTLVDKHLDLVRSFNYVAVSIYSTDISEYQRITEGNAFEKQFSIPDKVKAKPHRCIVGARCVINSINFKNIISLYKIAIESGYDYVIFIPAIDYENRGLSLSDKEREYLCKLVSENVDLINQTNTNLIDLMNRKFAYYLSDDYRKSMYDFSSCLMLEIRSNAFINFDGKVYLCQPDIGKEEFSIGDLKKNRFPEIWNSERHKKLIDKLNLRFKEGKCKNCRAISFNRAIDNYLSPEPFIKDYFL